MELKKLKFCFKGPTITLSDYTNWWRVWKTLPIKNWVLAASAFRERDYRKSADLYKRGIERHPNHPAIDCAKLDYAYALLQLEFHQEAQEILEELCDKSVALPDAYMILAKHYITGEMFVEALQLLKSAHESFPSQVKLLAYYAQTAWINGFQLIDEKEIEFRLIVARNKLTPRDDAWPLVTNALAVRCSKKERLNESDEYLSQVTAVGNAPVEAYILKYHQLALKQCTERAVDQLQRAIRLSPKDPRPVLEYAKHLSKATDAQTLNYAKQLAERASHLSFYRSPSALFLYSNLEHRLGNEEKAEILEVHSYMLKSERDLNFIDLDTLQVQLERLRQF